MLVILVSEFFRILVVDFPMISDLRYRRRLDLDCGMLHVVCVHVALDMVTGTIRHNQGR